MEDSSTVAIQDPPSAPLLHATFVRTAERRDRAHVELADGTAMRWNWASLGDRLPHDLVHLLIESAFGLCEGYWGQVARGVDMAHLAATPEADGPALSQPARTQLVQAEAAAALLAPSWTNPAGPISVSVALLAAACARLGVPPPAGVTAVSLRHARTMLDRCSKQWVALRGEGSLTLPFPFPPPVEPAADPPVVPAPPAHSLRA